MQKFITPALLIALISGLAIGSQSSLNSIAGKNTGATLTGLLVNFLGGIAAGLLLTVVYFRQGKAVFSSIQGSTMVIIVISGLLGIGIITGIAYALPRIGVAAGLAAIIFGQMVVALVVDTLGLTGGQPIPLNWSRIGGIALLALGTWAILTKK